jgi:hypothetical protein
LIATGAYSCRCQQDLWKASVILRWTMRAENAFGLKCGVRVLDDDSVYAMDATQGCVARTEQRGLGYANNAHHGQRRSFDLKCNGCHHLYHRE